MESIWECSYLSHSRIWRDFSCVLRMLLLKLNQKPNRGPHIPKIRAELNPPLKKMIAISLFWFFNTFSILSYANFIFSEYCNFYMSFRATAFRGTFRTSSNIYDKAFYKISPHIFKGSLFSAKNFILDIWS